MTSEGGSGHIFLQLNMITFTPCDYPFSIQPDGALIFPIFGS